MHPTETAIYEAAVRLIFERGYHGTSLRVIAEEVGLETASIYYHFKSKQELLLRIMRQTMLELTERVQEATAAADTPLAKFEAATRAHIFFHGKRQMEAFIADSELRALEPDNRKAIVRMRDEYESIFQDILNEDKGHFSISNVKLAVNALMSMCTGVAVWFRSGGELTLDDIADYYIHLFLTGITSSEKIEELMASG